ncbi:MAG: oxidoreductase [Chloroflexi bacterium HGW-Chloroflexi-10]|nr:MAG: oxidoreductase [Chloroflexi bacterium HGW-Chloroflexi-10]
MPHLFDPLTIKGVTLRNRIGVSPMCQYSYQDGFSNDWQVIHLGARAAGGAGLIIAEATAVEDIGRISPYDLGLWKDEQIEPLARVTKVIKDNGAVAGIQIAHAGRKACTQRPWEGGKPVPQNDPRWWQTIAPSPLPYTNEHQVPLTLENAQIKQVQLAFCLCAKRALAAGFEWLEIHAAHGYLIHNFYSPYSNQRTDQYGGDFENRIRFLVETIEQVRAVWPEHLPLTVRISASDWTEGGWTVEDSISLAKTLKDLGVDLIDCSSGGNVSKAIVPLGPGYQVHFAKAIRNAAAIPTAAVGLITSPMQADEIIQSGRADIVLLGREMLRDPYWAIHASKTLNQSFPIPPQYQRAF